MDKSLRAYLVEFVGTFFLVFLTACVSMLAHLDNGQPAIGLVGIAVAQGCLVAVLLTATFHVSDGCLNPVIPLVWWITGRHTPRHAFILIGVQLLAAALAGGLLILLFNEQQALLREGRVGAPYLKMWRPGGADSSPPLTALAAGTAIEGVLTFLLVFAVFATLIDPRRPKIGALGVGLAQTVCVLVGYHLSGGSMNPAVWFGTTLWHAALPAVQHPFADHTVFWLGPSLGAMLAGFVYTRLILPSEQKEAEHARTDAG